MSAIVPAARLRASFPIHIVKQRHNLLVTTGLDPVVHAEVQLCQQRKI